MFYNDDRAGLRLRRIRARLFDADGAPQGSDVSATVGFESEYLWSVTAVPDGFVIGGYASRSVTSSSTSSSESDGQGPFLAKMGPDGSFTGKRIMLTGIPAAAYPAVAWMGGQLAVLYGDFFDLRWPDLELAAGPFPFTTPVDSNNRYSRLTTGGTQLFAVSQTDSSEDRPRLALVGPLLCEL
jgi:hypothetical protein